MVITFDFRDVLEINIFCLSFLMIKKRKKEKKEEASPFLPSSSALEGEEPARFKDVNCTLNWSHVLHLSSAPLPTWHVDHASLPVTGIMTWRLDEFSGTACFGRLPRRGDSPPLMWPHATVPNRVLGLLCSLGVYDQSVKQTAHNQESFCLKLLAGFWAWQLAWKQGLGCEPYVFRNRLKTHSISWTLSHGWFACYKRHILFYNFILSILNV